MSPSKWLYPAAFVLLTVSLLSACAGTATQAQPAVATPTQAVVVQPTISSAPTMASTTGSGPTALPTQENPIAPETNPVGDIPDTQAFVSYLASPGNYSLDVPEGWARSVNGSDVQFISKFDGMSVTLKAVSSAPTADSVLQNEVATLTRAGHAFQVGQIQQVDLPAGHAIFIKATVNSDPDPVTGKQVRLDENIYLFYQNGTGAMLQLWAPLGTDNVDQWKRISESFRWK
jgi:hypothetical protein